MTFRTRIVRLATTTSLGLLLGGLAACGGGTTTSTSNEVSGTGEAGLGGSVLIDGSSTIFLISEAMAEEFSKENPGVEVTVNLSGSSSGFKKFCAGETDIANASRYIKDSELEVCKEAGIEFIEVPVGYDGVTLVINPENDWAECMTLDQLNAMWSPEAEEKGVDNWNKVDPSYPDQPLELYGPGPGNATFEYLTKKVNGKAEYGRGDYQATEDDNLIVTGVQADVGAFGYFGYAYYKENSASLKAVAIQNEAGDCVAPSAATIADKSYNPMSRSLFYYVSLDGYENKPEVKAFADFMIDPDNGFLIQSVGYVPLSDAEVAESQDRLNNKVTGKSSS